jgi:3D (Asp-Asp-Asp) domain-containing protein
MIRTAVILHFLVIAFVIGWIGDLLNENKRLKVIEQIELLAIYTLICQNEALVFKLDKQKENIVPVEVTAYPPLEKYTDDTPTITASNNEVRSGIVAVSRDLKKDYGITFGDTVTLCLEFDVEDLMGPRITGYSVDVFLWSEKDALHFGRRAGRLIIQ